MKKDKKRARCHGAVTVFLVIILVPCIVFASVFGDLSRVQLSMATSASAGDLALYSLLAHYDEDLKEYYGLVGSCQNIEEFYDITENYFVGMLQAEGVSGEGSKLFVEYLRSLESGDYSDFLRVSFPEDDVAVSAVENGAMGSNAALIEDGIVEFMKYRGPIQIATHLIERFSDMDFEKDISEAGENKEVVDAKQEYAEEQGELLEMALYTYMAIRAYEKEQEIGQQPSWSNYDSLSQDLDDIRDDLIGVTALVAKYYFPGTEELRDIVFPGFSVGNYHYDKEDVGIKVKHDGSDLYCIDNALLQKLLKDLDEDIQQVKDAGQSFLDATSGITLGSNHVVYCLQMQRAIDGTTVISTISSKGDSLLKRYARLQAALECEPKPEGNDLPEDWKEQINEAIEKIVDGDDSVFDDYLNPNGSSEYWTRVGQYSGISSTTVSQVQNRSYKFTSKFRGNGEVTIDLFCKSVASVLPEIYSELQEQLERLNIAIDGGKLKSNGKTVHSLDDLVQKTREFTDARNAWGSAAGAHDTDYANSEYALYQGASNPGESGSDNDEAAGERIAAAITPESVGDLKSRLSNIRSEIQSCLDAMDQFMYGGTVVKNFTSGEEMIQAARTVVPETSSSELSDAESAARGYANSLLSISDGKVYTVPQQNRAVDGNDPNLSNATPDLYKFLKEKLQGQEDAIESEVEENKKRNDEYKEQAENAKSDAQNVNNEYVVNKGKDLTDIHSGNAFGLLSALSSIVTVAQNVIDGSGDELRDQIYVCEYIMDMFSYSSFENEGKYRLGLADDNDTAASSAVTYKDFPYDDYKEAWEKEDPLDVMRNQSLTNRPITQANNHAHLGEVEYILYGNASIDENLKKSYENIFAIREMMNLVSGFMLFYSGVKGTAGAINSIAGAIATATMGIVPTPVTKCVLIGVLATLESAKDMERLKKGGRVELFKSDEKEWVFNLNAADKLAELSGDGTLTSEKGLYYSDYMYIFLLIGLSSNSYSSMLLRVGDLIQANMRLTEGNSGFSLNKTQCYFQLSGTLRVKPLMIAVPLVSNSSSSANDMREWTDWCTYNVKVIRGYS